MVQTQRQFVMGIWIISRPDVFEGYYIETIFDNREDAFVWAKQRLKDLIGPRCVIGDPEEGIFACSSHVGTEKNCQDEFISVDPFTFDPSVPEDFAFRELRRLMMLGQGLLSTDALRKCVHAQWKKFETFEMPVLSKWDQWTIVQNAISRGDLAPMPKNDPEKESLANPVNALD